MSVTGSGDKREWGAVDTPHEQSINDKAPKMTRLDSADKDIKLMDLDVDKIEIDPVLKDGSIGDKYCEVKYNGSLVVLKFDDVPGWRRSPFKAGPAKKADGTQLGESWGMVVELNPEEYEKYREIEQHLIAKLSPRATELMGHTLKKPQPGKPAKKISATEFEDSYNSPLRAADAEKGWKATMRIGVQHEQTNKDGKPRKMPDINLSEYYGGNDMTPKEVGSIDDLNRNIAMCPTITLSRGIYFGNVCMPASHALSLLS